MTIFNWPLLDYLWRVLVFGSIVMTISFFMPLFMQLRLFKISPTELKKIWRFFHVQVFLILGLASVYLYFNQQTMIRCFEVFLKSPDSISLTRYLTRLWIGGFFGLVGVDLLRLIRSFKMSRSYVPSDETELNGQVRQTAIAIGLKSIPPILLQSSRQSPFVFGIFQPKIVFPKGFTGAVDGSTLRSVIAHEMVHIKDLDIIWGLLEHLVRRLFFFNPIVYLSQFIYRDIQEKSADQQAIQILKIKKSEFSSSFFEVIEFCRSDSTGPMLSLSSASSFKMLKSRMQYLLNDQDQPKKRRVVLMFLLGVVFSSGWSYVEAKNSILNSEFNKAEPNMCVQVQHEIVLEKFFHVEAAESVRCE